MSKKHQWVNDKCVKRKKKVINHSYEKELRDENFSIRHNLGFSLYEKIIKTNS